MDAQILNEKLNKQCKKSKAVGVNVALFDSKGIIYNYNYGFANKEKGIKSDNDSLYMIGSNTKVMTALGILKLREEGKLSLDDDIKMHIPEFEVKSYFEYDKITIENLLMHRSGLVSDLFHLILDKGRDYHEVITELKNTYLTAEPGKMFSYSNVGYNIVSLDEIALEDINVEKEQFYKISFYDGLKHIGSIEFVASGKELAADTVRIPIETSCEFPDESVVTFTELAMNPVSTKIYMTATVSYGKYDINLRGYDDLGNEIQFYLTHYGDGKGWFVLEPEEENYIREEASSLTLTVYAAEYPEESGKMNDDYQPVGEAFTIELP